MGAAKSMSDMSDSEAEQAIEGTVEPKLATTQQDVTQLRAEVVTESDKRRLDAVIAGLGQLHGGLINLAAGNYSGMDAVTEGMGTLTSAMGDKGIAICGSRPTA